MGFHLHQAWRMEQTNGSAFATKHVSYDSPSPPREGRILKPSFGPPWVPHTNWHARTHAYIYIYTCVTHAHTPSQTHANTHTHAYDSPSTHSRTITRAHRYTRRHAIYTHLRMRMTHSSPLQQTIHSRALFSLAVSRAEHKQCVALCAVVDMGGQHARKTRWKFDVSAHYAFGVKVYGEMYQLTDMCNLSVVHTHVWCGVDVHMYKCVCVCVNASKGSQSALKMNIHTLSSFFSSLLFTRVSCACLRVHMHVRVCHSTCMYAYFHVQVCIRVYIRIHTAILTSICIHAYTS